MTKTKTQEITKLIKQRNVLKRVIENAVNSLSAVADRFESELKLTLIFEKNGELKELNSKIFDIKSDIDTEEDLALDCEAEDAFQFKIMALQRKSAETQEVDNGDIQSIASSGGGSGHLNLKKIELRKFRGDVRDWIGWWTQFERVHEDVSLTPGEKFDHLLSAVEKDSNAWRIVTAFPPSSGNYPKVINYLKSEFGDESVLIETYIEDLLVILASRNEKSLFDLVMLLETKLRALETLGVTTDKYAMFLYPLVKACLPDHMLQAWQRYSRNQRSGTDGDSKEYTALENLLKFLRHEVEDETRRKATRSTLLPVDEKMMCLPTAMSLVTASRERSKLYNPEVSNCIFCDDFHKPELCELTRLKSREELKAIIIEKKGCLKCARVAGHFARSCRAKLKCDRCQRGHLTFLCYTTSQNNVAADNVLCVAIQDVTYLQTLIVEAMTVSGTVCLRVLCVTGSQRSYITNRAALRLQLPIVSTIKIRQAVFGGSELPERKVPMYRLQIKGIHGNYRRAVVIQVLEQGTICGNIPRVQDQDLINELKAQDVILTDTKENEGEVDLLIGSDILPNLYTGNRWETNKGPVVMETILGWVLFGRYKNVDYAETSKENVLTSMCLKVSCISDMWTLDTLGIQDPIETKCREQHNSLVTTKFKESLVVNAEGHYQVILPWKEGHPELECNRSMAFQRLLSTTKRLKSQSLYGEYEAVFNKWKDEGIIERVPLENVRNPCSFYLPHRGVLRPNSLSTRLRPVFDAAAKYKGISLNDCLETGPNLLEKLPTVLTRFRTGPVGITADLRQAFLSIALHPDDRDFVRFLWWNSENPSLVEDWRHSRVCFGLKSSPFHLNATILAHLDTVKERRETCELLKNSFYCDDLLVALHSFSEIEGFRREAQMIMNKGKFILDKWRHTCFGHLREQCVQPEASVLGIQWNTHNDTLACSIDLKNFNTCVTKRMLLSMAQSIFDPIGITAPTSILLKILIQKSWKDGLSWDHELPMDMRKVVQKWLEQSSLLKECVVPRAILSNGGHSSLHIFCDSSQSAYAACAFLREEISGKVTVNLVCAKNRVAPISAKTNIPRLELLGALIASRMYDNLVNSCGLSVNEIFFWCDSMVVLCWLQKVDGWKTFVSNRVREVRSLTRIEWWHFLPGEMNAADVPSRGCLPKELVQSQWWLGPDWLKNPRLMWPNEPIRMCEDALIEEKTTSVTSLILTDGEPFVINLSQYEKNVRVVAWILRFISNAKGDINNRNKSAIVSSAELIKAELTLFSVIQASLTAKELEGLQVFRGKDGLLRVNTKLMENSVTDQFRTPILLPGGHEVVKRLILARHKLWHHAGTGIMVSKLRDSFWILKARQKVKSVINKCVRCKKLKAKAAVPPFAPLPVERTTLTKCWENVGVDMFGPVVLRNGEKVYVAIFTCSVYRAVHFEVVDSMSTESFIRAMRRFIARRGRIKHAISDCGTNFVGTQSLIDQLDWDKLEEYFGLERLIWKRNPPASPWYGGFFERLIRSTKDLLKRTLGTASVTLEEFTTLLCEVESLINNRPLTYFSEDINDLTPLTPSMFFQDSVVVDVADLDSIDRENLCGRGQYLQKVREELRRRFKAEYLSLLVNRGKRNVSNIDKGDLVLIESDNKRITWPVGRIINILPGRDGERGRVAWVKTEKRVVLRPLQRLHPLEIDGAREIFTEGGNWQPQENPPRDGTPEPAMRCEDLLPDNEEVVTRAGRAVRPPARLDL